MTARRLRPARVLVVLAVAVAVAVGAGAAARVAVAASSGWTGVASVRLNPLPGNAFARNGDNVLRALTTDAQSVRSDAVVLDVARDTGVPADALRARTSIAVVPDSAVLAVSVRAGSSRDAVALARELTDRYLELRSDRAEQVASARRAALVARVQRAGDELSAAVETGAAASEQRILSRRLAVQRSALRSLVGVEQDAGEVIRVSGRASGPGADVPPSVATVGGALLGGAVALLGAAVLTRPLAARSPRRHGFPAARSSPGRSPA